MDGSAKLYNLEGGILAWQAALPEEIVQLSIDVAFQSVFSDWHQRLPGLNQA